MVYTAHLRPCSAIRRLHRDTPKLQSQRHLQRTPQRLVCLKERRQVAGCERKLLLASLLPAAFVPRFHNLHLQATVLWEKPIRKVVTWVTGPSALPLSNKFYIQTFTHRTLQSPRGVHRGQPLVWLPIPHRGPGKTFWFHGKSSDPDTAGWCPKAWWP